MNKKVGFLRYVEKCPFLFLLLFEFCFEIKYKKCGENFGSYHFFYTFVLEKQFDVV